MSTQVTADDASLLPLVSGRGKGARLMLTMGVSRALGDFDLVHRTSQISIKPFVSPHPEVVVWRAYRHQPGVGDYLVMATDGLWDVVTNEEVGRFLQAAWEEAEGAAGLQPTKVARGLVELARGERRDGYWEKVDGCLASGDDISAFVIPLTHSWEVETN